MSAFLRRLLAETLGVLGYRHFQRIYWGLRGPEIRRRYTYLDDLPVVAELIRKRGIKRVIEIGCGFGRMFPAYADGGCELVIATELSPFLLQEAREKGRALEQAGPTKFDVRGADLREFAAEETPVDLVSSTRVLQHIHSKDLDGIMRALTRLNPRYIYLNEHLEKGLKLPYFFPRDYDKLLSAHGYAPEEKGEIATLGQHYTVYRRKV